MELVYWAPLLAETVLTMIPHLGDEGRFRQMSVSQEERFKDEGNKNLIDLMLLKGKEFNKITRKKLLKTILSRKQTSILVLT